MRSCLPIEGDVEVFGERVGRVFWQDHPNVLLFHFTRGLRATADDADQCNGGTVRGVASRLLAMRSNCCNSRKNSMVTNPIGLLPNTVVPWCLALQSHGMWVLLTNLRPCTRFYVPHRPDNVACQGDVVEIACCQHVSSVKQRAFTDFWHACIVCLARGCWAQRRCGSTLRYDIDYNSDYVCCRIIGIIMLSILLSSYQSNYNHK